ncbi:MAG TPA: class I tRNA ligase family protein, partial [Thermoplasmata archaeon]|nr:class I tRNA ligase family protein [Thermoplasmata archaeon]
MLGNAYAEPLAPGVGMGLSLLDPQTGALRPLRARPGRPFSIYVCGPTVYDDPHVGHARTYLLFDVARRQLLADGVRVREVMNITDFEDKIFDRAVGLGVPWKRLARSEERRFLADLGRLHILPADLYPRASDHVPQMRRAVRALERTRRLELRDQGLVYRPAERTRRSLGAGSEASRHVVPEPRTPNPDGLELGEFSVWLPPHPGGPAWPSPWGPGTPGWHLECYVMSRQYLGLPVDLHGGGRDLVFPHHYAESELARALDHDRFSRHYLYGDFVTQNGVKMSKSTGNLVRIESAIEDGGAGAVRWYLLSTHYARPIEWDARGLAAARTTVEAVRGAFGSALRDRGGGSMPIEALDRLGEGVVRDLSRDLGTERALARIARFAQELGRAPRGAFPRGDRRRALRRISEIEARL